MALIDGTVTVIMHDSDAVVLPPELFYVLRGKVDNARPHFEIVQHRDGTRSLILTTQPAKPPKGT